MPDGSVEDPGGSEVRRVHQVVATLRMLCDPSTVGSCREDTSSETANKIQCLVESSAWNPGSMTSDLFINISMVSLYLDGDPVNQREE